MSETNDVQALREEVRVLRDLLETAGRDRDAARTEADKADDEVISLKTDHQRRVFEATKSLYDLMWQWKHRAEKAEAHLLRIADRLDEALQEPAK